MRAATREQVQSLGGRFVDTGIDAEVKDGYARELTDEEKAKAKEVVDSHIIAADAVITTAAIPGKPSPKLISADVVEQMKPGAVIVDMAAEGGGNCELTRPGEQYDHPNGVLIYGPLNIPAMLPVHASDQYARNLMHFLTPFIKDGELVLDWDDEVFGGSVLTHDGAIVQRRHPHARRRRRIMITGFAALYIFLLAAFTGYEVICRVPVILHTPLMSGSNFVHGIVVVGAMVALGRANTTPERIIGFLAVVLGAANAVGGYVVTERMLEMFKSTKEKQAPAKAGGDERLTSSRRATSPPPLLFILGLKGMSSPRTARRGIVWAGVGMLVAMVATFFEPDMTNYLLMVIAVAIGAAIAYVAAQARSR